jgi:hypothetical protein
MGFCHLKCRVGKSLVLPGVVVIFKPRSIAYETVEEKNEDLDRDQRFEIGEQAGTEESWFGGDDGPLG